MNSRRMLVSALMCLLVGLLANVPAWAQPPGGRGGARGRGMRAPTLPLLQALDADGDGELSAAEIANAVAALKTLDKNGDQRISREEMLPPFGGREGGFGGRGFGGFPDREQRGRGPGAGRAGEAGITAMVTRLMANDKNQDGKLDADELPARMRTLLADGDTNKDGVLDKDELTAIARRQFGAQDAGRPPEGRGERERGPREGGAERERGAREDGAEREGGQRERGERERGERGERDS